MFQSEATAPSGAVASAQGLDRAVVNLALNSRPMLSQRGARNGLKERINAISAQLKMAKFEEPLKFLSSESSEAEIVIQSLVLIVAQAPSPLVCATLRLCRYLLVDAKCVEAFLKQRFDFLVAACLAKPPQLLVERMQALKWLRQLFKVAPELMPASLGHAVVALCHGKADSLRRVGLETLREMASRRTDLVAAVNGLKDLFDAVVDHRVEDMAESISLTLLYLLNEHSTRRFVRPELTMQQLICTYTDLDVVETVQLEKWRTSRTAFAMMLRSYSGLILLASDPKAMKSLFALLRDASVLPRTHHAIIDTILSVIEPLTPMWVSEYHPSLEGDGGAGVGGTQQAATVHLLDPYLSLLISAFLHCGLLEGLVALGIQEEKGLSQKTNRLLVLILKMARRVCPVDRCDSMWSMTDYVDLAIGSVPDSSPESAAKDQEEKVSFATKLERGFETSSRACRTLELLARESNRTISGNPTDMDSSHKFIGGADILNKSIISVDDRHEEIDDVGALIRFIEANESVSPFVPRASRTRQRTMAHLQIRNDITMSLDLAMEKHVWEDQLNRSRVKSTKNWREWDWDAISDALESTLVNPDRLLEASRTKFVKRLAGFYCRRPGEISEFARLQWKHENLKYAGCGCKFFTLLVCHPEGLEFMMKNSRGSIAKLLAKELDLAIIGGPQSSSIFSPGAIFETMSREYFTIISAISEVSDGREYLTGSRLLDQLKRLGENPDLNYITRAIMCQLDYSFNGFFSRSLFKRWMTKGNRDLRLYGTTVLRSLLRSHVVDLEEWALDTLVDMAIGGQPEVAESATRTLEEASMNKRYLSAIVQKRPNIINNPSAECLLYRIASCRVGFQNLRQSEWLMNAMDAWRGPALVKYVKNVEAALGKIFVEANRASSENGDALLQSRLATEKHVGFGRPPQSAAAAVRVQSPVPLYLQALDSVESGEVRDQIGHLLKLPWHGYIKKTSQAGESANSLVEGHFDTSAVSSSNLSFEDDPLDQGSMRVRLTVMSTDDDISVVNENESEEKPRGISVGPDDTIAVSLKVGSRPLDRFGSLGEPERVDNIFASWSASRPAAGTSMQVPSTANSVESRSNGTPLLGSLRSVSSVDDEPLPNQFAVPPPEDYNDWCTFSPEERQEVTEKLLHLGTTQEVFGSGDACDEFWVTLERSPARFVFAGLQKALKDNFSGNWTLKAVDFVFKQEPGPPKNIPLPIHFLGEVAKTDEGCDYLHRNGIAEYLLRTARGPVSSEGNESADEPESCGCPSSWTSTERAPPPSLLRRAALWACGHIGSSVAGWSLIQSLDQDFLDFTISMATAADSLSFRGAAFSVLGLLSLSSMGAHALYTRGWDRASMQTVGVCLPSQLARLFHPLKYEFAGSPALFSDAMLQGISLGKIAALLTAEEHEVYTFAARLCNHKDHKQTSARLHKLSTSRDTKHAFQSQRLLLLIHYLLASYRFSLTARRFLLGLFADNKCEFDKHALDDLIQRVRVAEEEKKD